MVARCGSRKPIVLKEYQLEEEIIPFSSDRFVLFGSSKLLFCGASADHHRILIFTHSSTKSCRHVISFFCPFCERFKRENEMINCGEEKLIRYATGFLKLCFMFHGLEFQV